MNCGSKLPVRAIHRSIRQFGGFLVVGTANTMISLVLYELLIWIVPYWLAFTLCFVVGIIFLLFANTRLVFRRAVTIFSATAFVLFYMATYCLGLGVVAFLVEVMRVPQAYAPIGGLAVMTPINFLGNRFVFTR
jgi:putative flippase GtrA